VLDCVGKRKVLKWFCDIVVTIPYTERPYLFGWVTINACFFIGDVNSQTIFAVEFEATAIPASVVNF
tara:strand:+ start:846 stop:1046 length:201 start_codon:yes stop_codon:yes gene_type:complete